MLVGWLGFQRKASWKAFLLSKGAVEIERGVVELLLSGQIFNQMNGCERTMTDNPLKSATVSLEHPHGTPRQRMFRSYARISCFQSIFSTPFSLFHLRLFFVV